MPGLYELFMGVGEFEREEAPEPSLLAFVARMAHPGDIPRVVDITRNVALNGGGAPPWYALWEVVIDTLVGDPAGDRIPEPTWPLSELELRVRAVALSNDRWEASEHVVSEVLGSAEPHLAGRLAPYVALDVLDRIVAALDPGALPAEPARALLAARNRSGTAIDPVWLDQLVEGRRVMDHELSRRAHLVLELPVERQVAIVDELIADMSDRMPHWFEALVVSRIASVAGDRWPERERPQLWNELIARLRAVPLLDAPHADVLRAHPYATELMSDTSRHEDSGYAADAIGDRWARRHDSVAPPPEEAPTRSSMRIPTQAAIDCAVDAELADANEDELAGADDDWSDSDGDSGDIGAPLDSAPPGRRGPRGRARGRKPDRGRRDQRPQRQHQNTRSARPEPADDPEPVERRLQADVVVDDAEVTRAFVVGATNTVSVSIGHGATIQAAVGFAEPEFRPEVDRMPLIVRFLADGQIQEQTIQLHRDRSRDSTTAAFDLTVTAGAASVSALIAVYHHDQPGQLIQAGVLRGPTVPDLASERAADTAIELVVDALVADAFSALVSSASASLVAAGDALLASDRETPVSIDRSVMAEAVQELSAAIQAAADLITLDETHLEPLLRDLAIHGRAFHSRIAARLPHAFHQATHLQVVAADPQDVLPLEFVYDGPPPTHESILCENWRAAVLAGTCVGCPGGGPDGDGDHPRVCPNRFWGVAKVVERHAKLVRAEGGFAVRSERSEGRERLGRFKGSVVGASELVSAKEVRATVSTSRATFGRTASQASTWTQWCGRIKKRPSVLVAMPHHAMDERVDPPIGGLELGGELLRSGAITAEHIRPDADRAGPLVMLVGCHTGADRTPFDSFAGDFRSQGASVVISTVGEIIADHAARAVQLLIGELGEQERRSGTVGEAVQMMRRKLLVDGNVLGLLIITHGDADWQLGD